MAVIALLRLYHFTNDAAYKERAEDTLETFAGIVDHFAVTLARQVQTARKHLARLGGTVPRITITLRPSGIVPIAMIYAVTCVVSIVVAFRFVMGLGR